MKNRIIGFIVSIFVLVVVIGSMTRPGVRFGGGDIPVKAGFSVKYPNNAQGIASATGIYRYVYSLNTSDNLYYRLVKIDDQSNGNQIWDENAGALGAVASVSWANSAVKEAATNCTLTDNRLTAGGWLPMLDETSPKIPDGVYDMLFYNNATPAATDTLLLGRQIVVYKSRIIVFNDL
jgi:hypothetical protein